MSLGFSGQRDTKNHYGLCRVVVPKSHRFGETGSSFFKRLLRLTDDRLKLLETRVMAAQTFWSSLGAALAQADRNEALVYLHGYRNTFEDAAIRAAQIGFDLKFPGVTSFFSWPSQGSVEKYAADEATIEASEPFMVEYFRELASRCAPSKIHVIAHSMGNRGLLRSLDRITREGAAQAGIPFGQFILAAPDVDRDLFVQLAAAFARVNEVDPARKERVTLYASRTDLALASSGILHDAPRAGFVPPPTVVDGIDTVEVSRIDLTLLGHSYFGNAHEVLHDIHDLLMNNREPKQRLQVEPVEKAKPPYWRLRE